MRNCLPLFAAFMTACSAPTAAQAADDPETEYVNPVYEPDFPDPTVIRTADGWFYAYSTQSNHDGVRLVVPIIRSADLVNWEPVGAALDKIPGWKTTTPGGVWAPNINFINGKYYLYYSLAKWDDTNEGCGLAVSDMPEGPFTDLGKLFDVSGIGVENCIDPFYISDGGKHYLFFGSHAGLYGIELNGDATAIRGEKFQVAAMGIEAAYIYRRNGWYYLFGSNGKCCQGETSSYKISVARSRDLRGPYLTKEGRNFMDGVATAPILQGNDVLIGPGHNGEIVTDDRGDDWIIYHAIVRGEATRPGGGTWRRLCIDPVRWTDDGWCVIGDGTPSFTPRTAPLFR